MDKKEFKLGKWNFKIGGWKVQVNDTKFEHPLGVAMLIGLVLLVATTVAQVALTVLSVLSMVLYFAIGAVFVFALAHYALRLFGRRGFFEEIEEEHVSDAGEKTKTKRYELEFESAISKKRPVQAEEN